MGRNFKTRYVVESKTAYGEDQFTISLLPKNNFIKPKPGQYIYLQTKRFGEAHPYSVLHFDNTTNQLTFGIKAVGPQSKKLENVQVGQTLYLDGAYGTFTQETIDKAPRIYYAAGIGITPFVDRILQSNNPQQSLLYTVFKHEQLVYTDELKQKLGYNLHIFITAEKKQKGSSKKLISKEVCAEILKDYPTNTEHFLCGSKGFMTAIKTILLELGVDKNNIYTEEFSN